MSKMSPVQVEGMRQQGFLPAREVCRILGIRPATLYNRINNLGLYDTHRVGKFWYIKVVSIDDEPDHVTDQLWKCLGKEPPRDVQRRVDAAMAV